MYNVMYFSVITEGFMTWNLSSKGYKVSTMSDTENSTLPPPKVLVTIYLIRNIYDTQVHVRTIKSCHKALIVNQSCCILFNAVSRTPNLY